MASTIYTLLDDFKYKGVWWLAEEPNHKVGGTLLYKNGGKISLELLGFLGTFLPDKQYEVVLGITDNGTRCTLVEVKTSRSNLNFTGMQTESYRAALLLVGGHFSNLDNITFSCVCINYSSLEEWFGHIAFDSHFENKDGKVCGITTKLILPDQIQSYIPTLDANIDLGSTWATDSEGLHSSNLKYRMIMTISSKDNRSYGWYLKNIHHLRNLLVLLVGDCVCPLQICAFSKHGGEGQKKRRQPIYVYRNFVGHELSDSVPKHEIRIPFSAVQDNIAQLLEGWFSMLELLKPSIDLFLMTFHSPDIYLDVQFLCLMHSVESFHRRRYGGRYVDEKEYANYKKALIAALDTEMPKDLRASLKSRFKFGNEYSLRKRMSLLLKDIDPRIRKWITKDISEFVKTSVDTRNYLTHYDEESKLNSVSDDVGKLWDMTERLKIFLAVLLLTEMGIASDLIADRFANLHRLARFRVAD